MPDSAQAPLSPARSALAVFAGFVVLNLLNFLFAIACSVLAGGWFPEGGGPTTNGLVLGFVGELANATLAGLATARLAGRAPLAHAGILAGVFGFMMMASMGELRAYPGWAVICFVALAPVGCLLGGLVATRVGPRT